MQDEVAKHDNKISRCSKNVLSLNIKILDKQVSSVFYVS